MKKITQIEGITEEHIDIMMEGYNSKELFGPELWSCLEKMIVGYDHNCTKQRHSLDNIINSLPDLIPCDECAEHFEQQLNNNYPPLGSRLKMLEWIITLHDNVNERNGKPRLGWKDGLKSISERITKNLPN